MNEDLVPAIVTLKKKGQPTRRMCFLDHNDAWDTLKCMAERGWKGSMVVCEVYQPGQMPPVQLNMFDMFDRAGGVVDVRIKDSTEARGHMGHLGFPGSPS